MRSKLKKNKKPSFFKRKKQLLNAIVLGHRVRKAYQWILNEPIGIETLQIIVEYLEQKHFPPES